MDKILNTEWNYLEFVTFLMIYASHVDMDFSEEEIKRISSSISEKTYQKMYNEFDSRSDFESLQIILNYKGLYYPTSERKNELLNKVKMLFFADGDYSTMERELMHFFKKLM